MSVSTLRLFNCFKFLSDSHDQCQNTYREIDRFCVPSYSTLQVVCIYIIYTIRVVFLLNFPLIFVEIGDLQVSMLELGPLLGRFWLFIAHHLHLSFF